MRAERLAPLAPIAATAGFSVAVGALLPVWPAIALFAVLLGVLYVWILADWRRGVLLLAVVLPFAGVPAFLLDSKYALIARDVAIGVPLYGSFLIAVVLGRERLALRRTWLAWAAFLFALVVTLHILTAPSYLTGLVGAKVWLFYIPMIAVGYHYVRSTRDVLQFLKATVLLALIPATLGIVEWVVASRTGDLGPFSRLYGSLTENVTGQYVKTSEIRFSRVPSTFTSVSQYVSFCYVALTAALAVALAHRTARWMAVVAVVGVAALTSGARAAFLIAPLLVWLGVLSSGVRLSRTVLALLASATIIGGLVAYSADLHAYKHELSLVAAVDGAHAVGEFGRWLHTDLIGDGTGSHTNAALRYGGGDVDQMVENWYARAGAEFGVAGLAFAIALLLSVGAAARNALLRLTGVHREIGGPILALVVMTTVVSFKGSILDIDPFNVYFWLLVGVLLKLGSIAAREDREDAASA
jgi:hypothetical protein